MHIWFYYVGFIVLLIQASASYAQIPGARQQPQWAMPLFFEDANGEKDTVWIGYDSQALKLANGPDSNYEYFYNKDSGKFQAALWTSYNYPLGSFDDSTKKVEVTSDITNQIQIGFLNGKMPVTMKWVDSLLYSDSLPFPDISPRPRARIELHCGNNFGAYSPCSDIIDGPYILLTDTIAPPITQERTYMDSLVFEGYTGASAGEDLTIDILQIVPHDAPRGGGGSVEDIASLGVQFYPNPASAFFQLICEPPFLVEDNYSLYNALGQLVASGKLDQSVNIVDLSALSNGILLLVINRSGHLASGMVVKN